METTENKRCKTCYGFGMWVDMTAPMGSTDARDKMPMVECPECKANPNLIKKEQMEQSNTKRTENGTEWILQNEEFFLAWDIGERILIIQFIQDLLKEKDELHKKELKEKMDMMEDLYRLTLQTNRLEYDDKTIEAYKEGFLDANMEKLKEMLTKNKDIKRICKKDYY